MAQYKKELKSKVLNTLVLVKNPNDIKDLINKIYQKKWANKEYNKHVPMHKSF